jgi:asparagine synthase (glutamine-hydrolysing)
MFLLAITPTLQDAANYRQQSLQTTATKLANYQILLVHDPENIQLTQKSHHLILTDGFQPLTEQQKDLLPTHDTHKLAQNLIQTLVHIDTRKQEIHIIKPLFSQKALYYHISSDQKAIHISTHIKLLKQAGIPIQENTEAIAEYFLFGRILSPETIYKNIQKSQAGQHLHVTLHNNELAFTTQNHQYPQPNTNTKIDEQQTTEPLIQILNQTLAPLKPIADKTAISFSGGLDSTVLAQTLKQQGADVHAYSITYPFENQQETTEHKYATTAAQALHFNHTPLTMTPKHYLETLIDMIANGEELIWYYLQTPLLCHIIKQTPENTKIMIIGDGPDTLFGSQAHRTAYYLTEAKHSKNPKHLARALLLKVAKNKTAKKALQKILKLLNKEPTLETATSVVDADLENANHFLWRQAIIGDEQWIRQKFDTTANQIISNAHRKVKHLQNQTIYSQISQLVFLGAAINTTVAKNAEKHNKKLYIPYYNEPLVDYVLQIPWKYHLKEPKHALRNVAQKIGIPGFIITRPKSGFATKPELWALPGKMFQPIIDLCTDVFTEQEFRQMQTDTKKAATLWLMINYSLWKKMLIQNISPEELKRRLDQSFIRSK